MSFSRIFKTYMDVARAMGHKSFRIPVNNPVSKGFNQSYLIQCRRCQGLGLEKGKTDNCQQCNGKGTEKVSAKTMRREYAKFIKANPQPVKQEKQITLEDLK